MRSSRGCGSEPEALANQDQADPAGDALSVEDTDFVDRAPLLSECLHPRVLARQRDLAQAAHRVLERGHDLVDADNPDHGLRAEDVAAEAAPRRVAHEGDAVLSEGVDA